MPSTWEEAARAENAENFLGGRSGVPCPQLAAGTGPVYSPCLEILP